VLEKGTGRELLNKESIERTRLKKGKREVKNRKRHHEKKKGGGHLGRGYLLSGKNKMGVAPMFIILREIKK